MRWARSSTGWSTESGWTVTGAVRRRAGQGRGEARLHAVPPFLSFGEDMTQPYVQALEARGVRHVLVGGKTFHDREEVETHPRRAGGDRVAGRRAVGVRDAARRAVCDRRRGAARMEAGRSRQRLRRASIRSGFPRAVPSHLAPIAARAAGAADGCTAAATTCRSPRPSTN